MIDLSFTKTKTNTEIIFTRSQAVARIADRTAKNSSGHMT